MTVAQERLNKARANLLIHQPFYGVLLSMLDFVEDPELGKHSGHKTMATNGKSIFFHPEFVAKIDDKELLGVLLHEINHCIYSHCDADRVGRRDFETWNCAADFAINYEIRAMGYTLPEPHLYDEEYKDLTVEQIYKLLEGNSITIILANGDKKCIHGYGGNIDDLIKKLLDEHRITKDAADAIREKILRAYEATRNQGNLPAGVERLIKEMRRAKVCWERQFHRYVGATIAHDDFSFIKPNKRYISHGLYMPTLHNPIIGNVAVAIDTSGSITPDDVAQFSGELRKISHLVDEVTVMTCDAAVHEVVKVWKFGDFSKTLKMKGGGGTDFNPPFNKVRELKMRPELMIYLTDTFGTFPTKAPPYPVLWCSTVEESKATKPPFGQTIYMG
jgi:predicted metal-dependent peptidase